MTDSTIVETAEPAIVVRHCLNCGEPMQGSFCAHCGQEEKNVLRPFLYFLLELLRVVLELDGRAYRTTYFLQTRPGFLTKEYFAGRRVSYTPPLRLFLIVSIGFFLIVSVVGSVQSMRETVAEIETTDVPAEEFEPEAVEEETPQLFFGDSGDGELDSDYDEILLFTDSLELPFLDAEANSNLQAFLTAQVRSNLEELTSDPRSFLMDSLEYVTFFMLIMMPILALIQQIMLVLCRRYYVEHLVLTVHNHAFLLLMIFITMILGLFENVSVAYIGGAAQLLSSIAVIWIFIYLFLSLRSYFDLGWFTGALAFFITSAIYAVVLAVGLFFFGFLFVVFS